MMRRTRAFTLIEVLVALAIVAVALAAGMRALAQSADGIPPEFLIHAPDVGLK